MRITILSRENCHLCEIAKGVITEVMNRTASAVTVTMIEFDVDRDPHLAAAYGNDVPVVLIDDREEFRHRVDPERLASILRGQRTDYERGDEMSLSEETCIPCRGGVPPLTESEQKPLLASLQKGWRVNGGHDLEREFTFPDFKGALEFTNRVGAIAEEQGHHPDISLAWGKVGIKIWTHKIDGLTRSDFVMAAKIDEISP